MNTVVHPAGGREVEVDVVVVGAGPAGLLLAHLLRRQGLDVVVLERRSRAHLESRVRAGLLEQGTVEVLRRAGLAAHLDAEALVHGGLELRIDGVGHRLSFRELTGRSVFMYGQQLVVRDLLEAADGDGAAMLFEAEDVQLSGLGSPAPMVRVRTAEGSLTIRCRAVAGCDGYRGTCRRAVPAGVFRELTCEYPYSWFGALVHTPPVSEELVYAISDRGFALFSMRSPSLSRVYLQMPRATQAHEVSDEYLWSELQERLGREGPRLKSGPIVERVMVDLRSVVVEPMQHGRLFLAGDAAHIVPPSAAKGLNLAVEDAEALAEALVADLRDGEPDLLATYSQRRLPHVWQTQAFSDAATTLFHTPNGSDGDDVMVGDRLRRATLHRIVRSTTAARDFAEHYVGVARR